MIIMLPNDDDFFFIPYMIQTLKKLSLWALVKIEIDKLEGILTEGEIPEPLKALIAIELLEGTESWKFEQEKGNKLPIYSLVCKFYQESFYVSQENYWLGRYAIRKIDNDIFTMKYCGVVDLTIFRNSKLSDYSFPVDQKERWSPEYIRVGNLWTACPIISFKFDFEKETILEETAVKFYSSDDEFGFDWRGGKIYPPRCKQCYPDYANSY